MTWLLIGIGVWLLCALVAALVVVRAIRTADVREGRRRHRANFVVDEQPGAPVTAPPTPRWETPPIVHGTGTGVPTGSPLGPTGSPR
jgi:hypothetical protein